MKYVIANWKSNPRSLQDAQSLLSGYPKKTPLGVVICPPALFGFLVSKYHYVLGAQDVSIADRVITGDITASQLASFGVQYVIIGHSERRAMGETSSQVNQKLHNCLNCNITPIVCVGEQVRDTQGQYVLELRQQLQESFAGLTRQQLEQVIIAYEPVWAIGASAIRQCTPEEFQESLLLIQRELISVTGNMPIGAISVIYGGSVTNENVKQYITAGAEGVLLGRASLDPVVFADIVAQVYENNN